MAAVANGSPGPVHKRSPVSYAPKHPRGHWRNRSDHDDSLASQMGALGLGADSGVNHKQQRYDRRPQQNARPDQAELDLQAIQQLQQQNFLQAIIASQQSGQSQQAQQLMAIYEAQMAALAQNPELQAQMLMQAQAQQIIYNAQLQQAGLTPQLQQQQSYASPHDQRNALSAQIHANLNAKSGQSRNIASSNEPSHKYQTPKLNSQAALESASWRSPAVTNGEPRRAPSPAPGPKPRQGQEQPQRREGAAMSALLSRRQVSGKSPSLPSSEATSPNLPQPSGSTTSSPSIAEQSKLPKSQADLGKGRPKDGNSSGNPRAWSAPSVGPNAASKKVELPVRAASHTIGVTGQQSWAIRQPFGPPGEASELGEKNFQSRRRRQAGRNLGMLSRRGDTPVSTPILD